MKVDQVRDSVNCRVDEVRYFVKIVDVVRVDQVRVDQVGCSLHIIQRQNYVSNSKENSGKTHFTQEKLILI